MYMQVNVVGEEWEERAVPFVPPSLLNVCVCDTHIYIDMHGLKVYKPIYTHTHVSIYTHTHVYTYTHTFKNYIHTHLQQLDVQQHDAAGVQATDAADSQHTHFAQQRQHTYCLAAIPQETCATCHIHSQTHTHTDMTKHTYRHD